MNDYMHSKVEKIRTFDPDGVGSTSSNIFGLPFTIDEADVIIVPVPWDVTVSNTDGTSHGPENIFEQSAQIDLHDEMVSEPWKAGIAMEEISGETMALNTLLREKARSYIQWLEEKGSAEPNPRLQAFLREINVEGEKLTHDIKMRCLYYLEKGKLPVILGGDHSTPLGLIQALAQRNDTFGILQLDAHADLRPAYEGFTQSHASIMYNAMQLPQVTKFVQVGLRDFCSQEYELMRDNPARFTPFFARDMHRRAFEGESWKAICKDIVDALPQKVYISFDIDGLDPAYCPGTGTPVPGGISYSQALYLFEQVVHSGRTIIGFDLVETGPQPMDGIIACRILYRTIAMMLRSNGKA